LGGFEWDSEVNETSYWIVYASERERDRERETERQRETARESEQANIRDGDVCHW
jgi:hypothetical protein